MQDRILTKLYLDLLTASCMMPLNLTGYVLKRWPFGPDHISCSLQAFVYFCCGYTSIVCLLAITLNRFVIIIYRDLYIQLFSRRNVRTDLILIIYLIAGRSLSCHEALHFYKYLGANCRIFLLVYCAGIHASIAN